MLLNAFSAHVPSSSHFGHDNEARNGQTGLYKANNKGKIALTGAVRGSGVIIKIVAAADCLLLSPSYHSGLSLLVRTENFYS